MFHLFHLVHFYSFQKKKKEKHLSGLTPAETMHIPTIHLAMAAAALLSSTAAAGGHISNPADAETTLVTVIAEKVITYPATTMTREHGTTWTWEGTTEMRTIPAYTRDGVKHTASVLELHEKAGAVTALPTTETFSQRVYTQKAYSVTVKPGDDFIWD